MIEAILFDMNGVLMDDLDAVARANCEVIHFLGGKKIKSKVWFDEIGQEWPAFFMKYGVKRSDLPKVMALTKKAYPRYDEYIKLVPHVKEVLKKLYDTNIKLAILSGLNHSIIESNMKHFGLHKYFTFYIGCEDVKKQKPDPEGLKESIRRFGFEPKNILYIDDMPTIFSAAGKLGMQTLGFRSRISKDLSSAGHEIDDFRKILIYVR